MHKALPIRDLTRWRKYYGQSPWLPNRVEQQLGAITMLLITLMEGLGGQKVSKKNAIDFLALDLLKEKGPLADTSKTPEEIFAEEMEKATIDRRKIEMVFNHG